MNELRVFDNPDFGSIRTTLIDNEPWAVGKDVALALGYSDTVDTIKKHVDDEDKMGGQNAAPSVTDSRGRTQYPIWINESGIYSLILSSKLPNAKRFKRWVTSEVLPELRRTGTYAVSDAQEPPQNAVLPSRSLTVDDYIRAAQIVSTCRNERFPYVRELLQTAGIHISDITGCTGSREAVQKAEEASKGIEVCRLLNLAYRDYGWSSTRLGQLLGLATTQIQRYRTGSSYPKEPRSTLMLEALYREIPELADVPATTTE